jgi:dihydroxyacetone kinase
MASRAIAKGHLLTYLFNDPHNFPAESLRGFVRAFPTYVAQVHGGVIRATVSPTKQVSIVVGGGSGHYPAFAGWVGPGMAHGAVCGNVFSSPSASQVRSVVVKADNGGGTLMLFGNYAGDVLHFGLAAQELNAQGLDVRYVSVSDDIASDAPENCGDRRGIAGDLLVVKIAGAAAESGLNLDEVEAVTRRANSHTRSLGVAFSGCTLPGAAEPLFTVPEGKYALGLGIHGEAGLAMEPRASAKDLARLLVDGVMAEEPARGKDGYEGCVAVLLNGLGATKYEELFVLFTSVMDDLERRGAVLVNPVVGEQVTSLDMPGVSLSILFLDEELEELWTQPADTPAFRSGSLTGRGVREITVEDDTELAIEPGSHDSIAQAALILQAISTLARVAQEAEALLGTLDSVAGDGDHGQAMALGSVAALSSAQESARMSAGAHTLLVRAGRAWAEGAGGTSGALWGGALCTVAAGLSDVTAVGDHVLVDAIIAGAESVMRLGGAKPGDKTMVDATVPFAATLGCSFRTGAGIANAWREAACAATRAAKETSKIAAHKGRARIHGDQSIGYADPGATSFALLMTAVGAEMECPNQQREER